MAFAFTTPGRRPGAAPRIAEWAALAALAVAVGSGLMLIVAGPATLAAGPVAVRLDGVSAVMLVLVSFVGWVVLRYAATYMDGEDRQGAFTGWLCATLAAVMLLVTAGELWLFVLAWVATSVFLQRLLLFYPGRIAAQRAARKKWLTSRLGDLALITAAVLLYMGHGTGDIAEILAAARDGVAPAGAAWAPAFLAVAALLKSAQFPMHGWLTEVMETPTPVSALLHAGVINAGGFLLIRFADVMLLAPGVLAVLVMVGGFTALFGGLVMLTQPAVKTSLAWSTVAQMGFMILQCGLALFPLALLHIVAHSLYKAHAFLAAGQAVEGVAAIRRPGPVAMSQTAACECSRPLSRRPWRSSGLAPRFRAFALPTASPRRPWRSGAILDLRLWSYLLGVQGLADWSATPRTTDQGESRRNATLTTPGAELPLYGASDVLDSAASDEPSVSRGASYVIFFLFGCRRGVGNG